MTDRFVLSGRRYRVVDTTSKLLGLALVAGGLDVGGSTPLGLLLAVVGTACATMTVFVDHE
ncbi:hypothetical protein [Haloarcula salinisoli]|uniref:DUF8120 domain-containing protein n=1 Tax=Haloarcula salinisoli TaxID=2487746 RepID=A0A8J7YAU2_9EURY|nr:hypothetical protein [Halomicroarcula salinisoli]MBX0286365.1 hypothetical protein [Halomicroarcula salinisoli]MBX0302147.1 hypothetical protein [Halomicroarcula salinisoli]